MVFALSRGRMNKADGSSSSDSDNISSGFSFGPN